MKKYTLTTLAVLLGILTVIVLHVKLDKREVVSPAASTTTIYEYFVTFNTTKGPGSTFINVKEPLDSSEKVSSLMQYLAQQLQDQAFSLSDYKLIDSYATTTVFK